MRHTVAFSTGGTFIGIEFDFVFTTSRLTLHPDKRSKSTKENYAPNACNSVIEL